MTDTSGPALTVEEFVEYCRTRAGLLSGHVETMGAEADDLLDEIDEEMAEVRSRLEDHAKGLERTDGPPTATGPNPDEAALEAIEDLERDLERKQALVDATQARMRAFQDLASRYTDLAEELAERVDDGHDALTRVLEFEADADAPAYFEEETVLEAALEARRSDGE
ncbi:hypothetical protein ACFQGT_19185 [Natrialbaceae archaeon GCM10025810]|uniref:hypothetical protein n=1 Tax=Halovalidus salilacus TaxID=3075124 RepID=UPI003618E662